MEESVESKESVEAPIALRAVIWLFYIQGFYAVYDSFFLTEDDGLTFDLKILLIPCALGLSVFDNRWRIFALVAVMLILFMYGLFAGYVLIVANEYDQEIGVMEFIEFLAHIIVPIAIYAVLVSERVAILFKSEH